MELQGRLEHIAGSPDAALLGALLLSTAAAAPPPQAASSRSPVARHGAAVVCQVPGCDVNLSTSRLFHQRYHTCPAHCTAESVVMHGLMQRFCQQCGQFHPVDRFEGSMRSCRTQLARHAERRRVRRAQAKAKAAADAQQHAEAKRQADTAALLGECQAALPAQAVEEASQLSQLAHHWNQEQAAATAAARPRATSSAATASAAAAAAATAAPASHSALPGTGASGGVASMASGQGVGVKRARSPADAADEPSPKSTAPPASRGPYARPREQAAGSTASDESARSMHLGTVGTPTTAPPAAVEMLAVAVAQAAAATQAAVAAAALQPAAPLAPAAPQPAPQPAFHWQCPPPWQPSWPVQQQPTVLPAPWGLPAAPQPAQPQLLADLAAQLIAATVRAQQPAAPLVMPPPARLPLPAAPQLQEQSTAVLVALLAHMAAQQPAWL